MKRKEFYYWLREELASATTALLNAIAGKDRLLYSEAPALRREYMEKIGGFEAEVLAEELELAMLRRKEELIQRCINRREAIDLEEIEAQLEAERRSRLAELEEADKTLREMPQLSGSEQDELEEIYKDIVKKYHPALNPGTSDTQKDLYERALEAYKKQDLEGMKLLKDMLETEGGAIAFELSATEMEEEEETAQQVRKDYEKMAANLATDFTLAKELYWCFSQTEADAVVLPAVKKYKDMCREILEEIEGIRSGFPFNARGTLNNAQRVEEYIAELRVRQRKCREETEELTRHISRLMEVGANG